MRRGGSLREGKAQRSRTDSRGAGYNCTGRQPKASPRCRAFADIGESSNWIIKKHYSEAGKDQVEFGLEGIKGHIGARLRYTQRRFCGSSACSVSPRGIPISSSVWLSMASQSALLPSRRTLPKPEK
jgi:hypothetical protein